VHRPSPRAAVGAMPPHEGQSQSSPRVLDLAEGQKPCGAATAVQCEALTASESVTLAEGRLPEDMRRCRTVSTHGWHSHEEILAES